MEMPLGAAPLQVSVAFFSGSPLLRVKIRGSGLSLSFSEAHLSFLEHEATVM